MASASTIRGVVSDGTESLYGATVVVLEKSDSTMVAFGITDESGKFEIHDVPEGEFVLQVSYTGFTEYYQAFDLSGDKSNKEMGSIVLSESSAILQEVSIEAERIPMGILGDTINYNAAAFKTRKGASVEDLLKKMPGIEIARDGSIKAQGKDVENVLVDGKEFFSGDPTMATKNLEAEAVDKVQVYDKQSDEAEFTGIDDGQKEKTINLKLKEEYKNGGFGNVAVEGGTEETRLAKVNYNRFSPTMQASLIGNVNNINEQAFGFNDYIQFMGGLGNVMSGGGFQGSGLLGGGGREPKGINDQSTLGTNFNLDINSKLQTNMNYLYSGQETALNEVGEAINFTDLNDFDTRDTLNSDYSNANHRGSIKLDYEHNPRNVITLKSNMALTEKNGGENAVTRYLKDEISQTLTTNEQQSTVRNLNWNTDFIYKRKFGAKGRNWISSVKYDRASQQEDLDIDNSILFGNILDRVIQRQNLNGESSNLRISTKYKEPIGVGLYLGSHYIVNKNEQNPNRKFYNQVGQEFNLDQGLSDDFNRSWKTHTGGLSLRRNRKKLKMAAQLSYMNTNLQTYQLKENISGQNTNNYLLPSVTMDWDLKGSKRFEFYYTTNVNAPSISQLVTIPNNANPNYIVSGNPNLNPEYMHSIGSSYSSFDQFNFSNFFANFNLSLSSNKIINSTKYNDDFTTEVLPINASNYISTRLYLSHSKPIRPLKIKYSFNTNLSGEKFSTLLNEMNNDITSWNIDADIRIENRKKERLDMAGGFRFNANDYNSSFNTSSNYITYSWYTDANLNITESLFFSATYDYRTFDASFTGEKEVQHLVNLSLRQSFMEDKLAIELKAHDLLNENRGISRYGSQTALVDRRYNTLSRYFMLGVTYKLGKVKQTGITFSD